MRAAGALFLALALAPSGAFAGGISESEYRDLRPAPMELSVRLEGGAVLLTWGAPAPEADVAVARYRIERAAGGDPPRPIGESETSAFRDRAPPKGRVTYAVVALAPDGRALHRSDTVGLDIP